MILYNSKDSFTNRFLLEGSYNPFQSDLPAIPCFSSRGASRTLCTFAYFDKLIRCCMELNDISRFCHWIPSALWIQGYSGYVTSVLWMKNVMFTYHFCFLATTNLKNISKTNSSVIIQNSSNSINFLNLMKNYLIRFRKCGLKWMEA